MKTLPATWVNILKPAQELSRLVRDQHQLEEEFKSLNSVVLYLLFNAHDNGRFLGNSLVVGSTLSGLFHELFVSFCHGFSDSAQ